MNEPFLYQIIDTVIHENEGEYKDLRQKQDYITKVIRTEEENFAKTIDGGMKIFSELLAEHKAKGETQFAGSDAFKLYDTYGFPVDLTEEMVRDEGMTLDRAGFDQEMEAQRVRARKAREALGDLGWSGVGQYNDLVNPCAMMTLCGTIANRGTQVPPRLLLKETTAAGLRTGHSRAEKHSGTLSSDTCALLASMMRRNVTEHYGQSSFGSLAVCAKSGTAEVGSDARPHSWFTGFVDDADHPLAFVVVVENGGSGASAAGSVAAKVLTAAAEAGY